MGNQYHDNLGLNVRFYTVKSNLDFDLSSVHELMSNNKTIFYLSIISV